LEIVVLSSIHFEARVNLSETAMSSEL